MVDGKQESRLYQDIGGQSALSWMTNFYYCLKPCIPRYLQVMLRQHLIRQKRKKCEDIWPIDERAGVAPKGWLGWPEGRQFALVLTHDVDTARALSKCWKLAQLEMELGFRSSFNFVPERYSVPKDLRKYLVSNGFEVGIHGLLHDGKLFASKSIFMERAVKINHYLKDWKAVGFRSPAMHHKLGWMHILDIKYDLSTFDTDPFEPQSDGVRKIFPFWIPSNPEGGYVEMPYTLPQDFTIFVLMKEKTTEIWANKLNWISARGGMALLNTHPDYMSFDGNKPSAEEYEVGLYKEFLDYVSEKYSGNYWQVLPKEIAAFIRAKVLRRKRLPRSDCDGSG